MQAASFLIAGDFVLDRHIYEGRRHHYGDGLHQGVRVVKQLGGAGLIHGLLEHLLVRAAAQAPVADAPELPAWRSCFSGAASGELRVN